MMNKGNGSREQPYNYRSHTTQSETSGVKVTYRSGRDSSKQLNNSSNEELFADIERSRVENMNVSGESMESSSSEHNLVDQAFDLFADTKVILPTQQQQISEVDDQMIQDINQVFSEHCNTLQKYGSYADLLNSLPTNPSTSEQFYENNHRRKRKTISDEDSHNFVVRIDRIEGDKRTTVMVKNIPNKYTNQMLKELIDQNHANSYDFLYLPIDFKVFLYLIKNKCNMGYAFINFMDNTMIPSFHKEFHGQRWPHFNSEKVSYFFDSQICQLRYARIQGRSALLQHFQFSSVMNQKDKKLKPVIVPSSELSRIQQLIQLQKQ